MNRSGILGDFEKAREEAAKRVIEPGDSRSPEPQRERDIATAPPQVARRTAVWIGAAVLWLYAGLSLIVGLFFLSWFGPFGLGCIVGACLVAAGTRYTRRKRPLLGGVLLVAGGILVGGELGVLATLWEHDSLEALAAGFLIGALMVGWPPILAGIGLIGWSVSRPREAASTS